MSVDAQFTDRSVKDAYYGIVFRLTERYERADKFYLFNIKRTGTCVLLIRDTDSWVAIVTYSPSEFINKETGTNSLMVEMVGEEITGSVNGHVLVRATDRRLARGDVGVFFESAVKEYYEARFRNFRLYSIESVEKATIMQAPISPPPRRTRTSADDDYEIIIEKVTASSAASSKPRVAEPASSAQGPPDLRAYLEGVLNDAGMTDLTAQQREEMIQELSKSLNVFILSEIIDNMPEQHLEAFTRLYEENKPQAEINRFIEEHMPDARQIFAEIFEKFRRQYAGRTRLSGTH